MNDVAGWITFNVDVDKKTFEKKIKETEKEINKLDREAEKLKEQKAEIDLTDYYNEMDNIKKEYDEAVKKLSDPVSIEFTKGIADTEIQNVNKKYQDILNKQIEINEKEQENINKRKIEVQKLEELKRKMQDYNNQQNLSNISLDNVGNKMTDIVKKAGRWVLAIFSVRSAYAFVRSAVSTLSQSNEQLGTDLEYIRWALAKSLEPIIIRIVQWVYKVLQAINYVVNALTGVNLFANASAEAFKKTKDNLSGAGKSAKELQKTLAGFDEMNVLQESGATSYGGGGGGVTLPTEDLSKFNLLSDETKAKLDKVVATLRSIWEWIDKNIMPIVKTLWFGIIKPGIEKISDWINNDPQKLYSILLAIVGLKLASKLGVLDAIFGGINKKIDSAGGLTTVFKNGLTKLGTGASSLAGKIGMSAGGSGTLVGALIALDAILVTIATVEIVKTVKAFKELKEQIKEAKTISNDYVKSTEKTKNALIEKAKAGELNNDVAKKDIDLILDQIYDNQYLNRELSQHLGWKEKLTGEYKLNSQMIKDNTKANENNLEMLKALYDQGYMNTQQKIDYMNALRNEISNLELTNENLKENSEEYKTNKKKIEELQIALNNVKGDYDIGVNVDADKKPIDDVKKAIGDVAKNHTIKFDASTKKANSTIGSWLKGLGSTLFGTLFPNLNFTKILAKFHRKGGIINNPGKGVPIDIGGEAGREGIIPLTDQQQMEILGKSIGKYVTINLTNITKLDSREMQRTTEQVKADNNFIRNR